MGCCLSTTKSSKPQNHHNPSLESAQNGVAPPPPRALPALEEETVKEVVLSETPILKTPALNLDEHVKKDDNADSGVQGVRSESIGLSKPRTETAVMKPAEDITSEVSEYSEMWSVTESLSAATAPEKRDDDGEVTQRSPSRIPRKRRNSGDISGGREKVGRSPARQPATAPDRKGQVASSRVSQGRQTTTQRRTLGPGKAPRRDSGEGSGRRSRSPVTRGEVGMRRNARHKSPGVSETGRSGDRSPAKPVNNAVEVEKPSGVVLAEDNESLENPVVSMECFIFL